MDNDPLLALLKEFIKEYKESAIINAQEHKEINQCLSSVKLKLGSVEGLCQNSDRIRKNCYKKQDDVELRLRELELMKPLLDLPDKFDTVVAKFDSLAGKVYKIVGAMTLVMAVAGWMMRK